MLFLSIVHHYLLWHYSRAFLEIFHVWLNLLGFVVQFFSIPQLLRSWFSPWKRITETRGEKWNLEDLAGFIIIGFFSRIIGFILRTIVLALGFICLFIVVAAGLVTYIFWTIAPMVIIITFGFGITLLFT